MLYILYGSDTQRAVAQASKLVAGLRARRPEVLVYTFDSASVQVADIDALVEASGLFVEKHIVVLRSLFESKEMGDMVAQRAEHFARSQNIFIIVDGRLLVEHTRALLPHAHKVEEYHAPKKDRVFDAFGLVSALKRRDRRALWEAYVRATRSGESPEAVCGLLHWAVRDMCTSYSRYARVYSMTELRAHSRTLLTLYHEAHRGRYDMGTALEQWTLTV
jgi:DNA polymerase III delta subunit